MTNGDGIAWTRQAPTLNLSHGNERRNHFFLQKISFPQISTFCFENDDAAAVHVLDLQTCPGPFRSSSTSLSSVSFVSSRRRCCRCCCWRQSVAKASSGEMSCWCSFQFPQIRCFSRRDSIKSPERNLSFDFTRRTFRWTQIFLGQLDRSMDQSHVRTECLSTICRGKKGRNHVTVAWLKKLSMTRLIKNRKVLLLRRSTPHPTWRASKRSTISWRSTRPASEWMTWCTTGYRRPCWPLSSTRTGSRWCWNWVRVCRRAWPQPRPPPRCSLQ